jgi:type I restriction enzyme S subunit
MDLPENTDPEFEFQYIEISAVGRGALVQEPQHMRFGDAPSRARRLASSGDTIISTVRTYLRSVMHIAKADGLVMSTGFAVISPESDIDPRYLSRVIESDSFIEEVVARSVGVSYPAIAPTELGAIRVPVPNRAEQRAIADYLAVETSRIDALVDARQRTIGLLDERRAALIEVETTRYGVPTRLHWLLSGHITDGPHETPEFLSDGVPFMSAEQIVDNSLDFDHCLYVSAEAHEAYSRKCRPQTGDVLVCKTGATIGKVAAVDTHRTFGIWSPLALLRPDTRLLRSRYLWYCLQGAGVQQQIRLAATQNTQPNISMPDIGDLTIRIPSSDHQDTVVRELDRALAVVRSIKQKLHRQVGLLQERRRGLITAAVTGLITIPEVA